MDVSDLTQAIAALLTWIAANTGYVDAAKAPPPRVQISTSAQMASACATCAPGAAAAAVYECDRRTMTIDAGLLDRPAVVQNQIIVHELVHHAQCIAWGSFPRERECEAEREAYAVQYRYAVSVFGDTPEIRQHRERLAAIAEKACAASRR